MQLTGKVSVKQRAGESRRSNASGDANRAPMLTWQAGGVS